MSHQPDPYLAATRARRTLNVVLAMADRLGLDLDQDGTPIDGAAVIASEPSTDGRHTPAGHTRFITIPAPHVVHGPQGVPPHEADAHYMRHAASNLEGKYEVGGSGVRGAVVDLLRDVATALLDAPDEQPIAFAPGTNAAYRTAVHEGIRQGIEAVLTGPANREAVRAAAAAVLAIPVPTPGSVCCDCEHAEAPEPAVEPRQTMRRLTVMMHCNGCGRVLRPITQQEGENAIVGRVDDVRGECPACTPPEGAARPLCTAEHPTYRGMVCVLPPHGATAHDDGDGTEWA